MFIHFDKNKLHVQMIVGSLEEYKPSDKIKEIQAKVTALRTKVEEFQSQVVFPELQALEKEIAEENNKFSGPKENTVK